MIWAELNQVVVVQLESVRCGIALDIGEVTTARKSSLFRPIPLPRQFESHGSNSGSIRMTNKPCICSSPSKLRKTHQTST